jgi:hypothetical protein
MGRGSDQYSLRQQQSLLEAREQALRVVGVKKRKDVDADCLKRLREIAPLGLAPCLIQRRRNEGFIAAQLIQRIGDKSYRFLFRAENWRIARAKKGTQVIRVRGEHEPLFEQVVSMQESFCCGLAGLLDFLHERKSA